ncbi:MAG TPA: hypothetical protein VFE47_06780 [Tepidisphaeraceae bacterium]|nr:hypothetical protein [Tepidisphaeraceae bacterium]
MTEMYKQCELTKPMDGGLGRMISWIPQRIAVVGKVVTLKDVDNGTLTAGWRVENVAELLLSEKILQRQSRDHLRTRKASDG